MIGRLTSILIFNITGIHLCPNSSTSIYLFINSFAFLPVLDGQLCDRKLVRGRAGTNLQQRAQIGIGPSLLLGGHGTPALPTEVLAWVSRVYFFLPNLSLPGLFHYCCSPFHSGKSTDVRSHRHWQDQTFQYKKQIWRMIDVISWLSWFTDTRVAAIVKQAALLFPYST